MLSDFERQQCRDFKKRLDMAEKLEGLAAIKIASQRQRAQAGMETILQHYKNSDIPIDFPKAEAKETATDQILKFYK